MVIANSETRRRCVQVAHPSGSVSEKCEHADKTLDYIRAVPGLSELKPSGQNVCTCPALNPTLTIDYIFHGRRPPPASGSCFKQATCCCDLRERSHCDVSHGYAGSGLVALSGEVQAQENPPSDHLPVIGWFKVA